MTGPERNRIEPNVGAMRRRDFVALAAAILAIGSIRAVAQASTRRPLIAVLLGGSQTTVQRWLGAFPDELQSSGYVEHRDYEAEYRYADGDLGRLPRLAAELASLNPDVIVVASTAAALAAKRAAPSTPIVVAAASNPVRFGLGKDHARPGRNITGMLAGFDRLAGKQLELGLQLLPGKRQAGMLVNNSNVISGPHKQDAETAAQAKGVDLTLATASRPADLDSAIHELASRRVDFLIVPADAMFLSERRRIAELELSMKLPTVYAFREHVEDGGLMSYGVDLRGQFRRAAAYVDKILRGEKPSDLPFEQPTTFELVVNFRTAKELGVTVPASLLARADEIIE
jgi:putative ABC transport system substrate-binding protein